MNMFSRKNRKGFTLIELIVVIAILAILAAIAIPSFLGISENAKVQVDRANATIIANAYNTHNALHPDNLLGTPASYADMTAAGEMDPALVPKGLDAADITAAWPYVTITDNVADVLETLPAAPAAG